MDFEQDLPLDPAESIFARSVQSDQEGIESMKTWIRDPIAMLAKGGKRGLVVEDDRIVELVGHDGPAPPCDEVFGARRHVIVPGLVNAHHHFFQTLTRPSAGYQQEPVSVAAAALSDLGCTS